MISIDRNAISINLTGRGLTRVPRKLFRCRKLKSLSLSKNRLTEIPPKLATLPNLEQLNLSHNQLTRIPSELGRLHNLWKLSLNGNQLTSLPAELGMLSNLTWLQLNRNQLTELPRELGAMSKLIRLYVRENQLTSLPDTLGKLSCLTILAANRNQLVSVPPELGDLVALSQLDLSENTLRSLPPELGRLATLTQLDLSKNTLRSLPPELGDLVALSQLRLQGNHLTAIPRELAKLSNLPDLDLSRNRLKEFPALSNLERLDLSRNQITMLPHDLRRCSKLAVLNLSANLLTSVPSQLGLLKNLRSLNLRGNRLTSVPMTLGMIPTLDLSDNQLTSLPPTLSPVFGIYGVHFNGNPVYDEPRPAQKFETAMSTKRAIIRDGTALVFHEVDGMPSLHIRFVRTLRVPDDGHRYPLPAGMGLLPVRACTDATGQVPAQWRQEYSFMIPLHPGETFWLALDGAPGRPCALKVGTGGINVISGKSWDPTSLQGGHRPSLRQHPMGTRPMQDYVVCPPQRWLDGYSTERGTIRQFVAVPRGKNPTVEGQLTGREQCGELALAVYGSRRMECFAMTLPHEPLPKPARVSGLGVGAGGRVSQKIYPDRRGSDHWEPDAFVFASVHFVPAAAWQGLTGDAPPAVPANPRLFAALGYPWFEYDESDMDDIEPAASLRSTKSVNEREGS